MIFKINMAACVIFAFGSLGILLSSFDLSSFAPSDLAIVAFFWSPALLWAAGAWVVRRGHWSPIVWLLTSVILMVIEWYGLFLDGKATREEAISKQYTMHFAGYVATLLQWAVGLPLLAIHTLIRLLTGRKAKKLESR